MLAAWYTGTLCGIMQLLINSDEAYHRLLQKEHFGHGHEARVAAGHKVRHVHFKCQHQVGQGARRPQPSNIRVTALQRAACHYLPATDDRQC